MTVARGQLCRRGVGAVVDLDQATKLGNNVEDAEIIGKCEPSEWNLK